MKQYSENNKNSKKWFLNTPRKFTFKSACILLFITFIVAALSYGAVMFFSKNVARIEDKSVNCTEVGEINYDVNLKEQQDYLPEIMESNMSYISSLIDTINLKCKYNLEYDRNVDHQYSYKILADFRVKDKSAGGNGDSVLLSFTDEIYNEDKQSEKSDNINISKEIHFPYSKYNNIATKFAEKNNIDMESFVNIRFVVNTDGQSEDVNSMKRTSDMCLKIPLYSKTIDIDESNSKINNNFTFDAYILNVRNVSLGIICLIFAVTILLMECVIISSYIPKYRNYYKKLNTIFRNYSHLIVNVIGENSFKQTFDEKVPLRYVKDFESLVVACECLHKPIKCYRNAGDAKVYFIVDDSKFERYVFVMHDSD